MLARPSAGIGVVEVQKTMAFAISNVPRDPLQGSACKNQCFFFAISKVPGDRRGRGAKTNGFFAISKIPARPSAGIGVVEVQKPIVFFSISAVPAQPSAGIGVVEVQKLEVFCDFC